MEFNLPTNKEEMYAILNELYHYYRITRPVYQGANLTEMTLTRLEYTPPTDEEILIRAEKAVSAKHERELIEYKSALNEEITYLTEKIALTEKNLISETDSIKTLYDESVKSLTERAVNSGLYSSSVIVDKIAVLEDGKNKSIAEANRKSNEEIATLSAKKQTAENKLLGAEDYFLSVHDSEVEDMRLKLLDERNEKVTEVFKYNNGLDEKEQRYSNTVKQANANLQLRFLDISTGEFTKEQLTEMGYYTDVIKCVCGYYDTLSATDAFADLGSEKKLAVYLDDHYQNILYAYNLRAQSA